MKTKLQHVVLTSLMSLILCGCAANNQNSGEDIPTDPSYKSENNWEDMITNLNLFTKDISFEMEILDEDGDRYVIDKENNQFAAQFFSGDEEQLQSISRMTKIVSAMAMFTRGPFMVNVVKFLIIH